MSDPEKGFTIIDRRGSGGDASPEPQPAELPAADFTSFLLSLGTSALFHLGLVAEPGSDAPPEVNLPVARQTIDTLELLEQKTKGNLSAEESELLRNLLTDLRMRFVAVSRGARE